MSEQRHRCYSCRAAYSATVGTLFQGTRLPLSKWFRAVWLMEESERDPSSRALAATLNINRNSACYMAMRIRRARTRESALLWAISQEMQKWERQK